MNPVAVALALVIGTSLGLVGGGGSILTAPAFVHAAGSLLAMRSSRRLS